MFLSCCFVFLIYLFHASVVAVVVKTAMFIGHFDNMRLICQHFLSKNKEIRNRKVVAHNIEDTAFSL